MIYRGLGKPDNRTWKKFKKIVLYYNLLKNGNYKRLKRVFTKLWLL